MRKIIIVSKFLRVLAGTAAITVWLLGSSSKAIAQNIYDIYRVDSNDSTPVKLHGAPGYAWLNPYRDKDADPESDPLLLTGNDGYFYRFLSKNSVQKVQGIPGPIRADGPDLVQACGLGIYLVGTDGNLYHLMAGGSVRKVKGLPVKSGRISALQCFDGTAYVGMDSNVMVNGLYRVSSDDKATRVSGPAYGDGISKLHAVEEVLLVTTEAGDIYRINSGQTMASQAHGLSNFDFNDAKGFAGYNYLSGSSVLWLDPNNERALPVAGITSQGYFGQFQQCGDSLFIGSSGSLYRIPPEGAAVKILGLPVSGYQLCSAGGRTYIATSGCELYDMSGDGLTAKRIQGIPNNREIVALRQSGNRLLVELGMPIKNTHDLLNENIVDRLLLISPNRQTPTVVLGFMDVMPENIVPFDADVYIADQTSAVYRLAPNSQTVVPCNWFLRNTYPMALFVHNGSLFITTQWDKP